MKGSWITHPATTISLVALFLGGTGGAFAASIIDGHTIKAHSIPMSALAPRAVQALRGQQGIAGPQGIQGVQGPAGANGTFAIDKVSVVLGPGITVNPGEVQTAQANCPSGSVAVGGGGSASIAGIDISKAIGSPPNAWYVATANQTSVPVTLQAQVVCVAP